MSDHAMEFEQDQIDLDALQRSTAAGRARAEALADFDEPPGAMEWVEYHSEGRLLIIGPADAAWPVAEQLKSRLRCIVLATEPPADAPEFAPPVKTIDGRPHDITGYLGQFTLKVEVDRGRIVDAAAAFGIDPGSFDMILNLDRSADPGMDLPPLGYYRAESESGLARALAELPEMLGDFQKPRFFAYDPEICAHGSRGLKGCSNCLDACATGAAISIGEKVEIDPMLCQGCGSCVTVCPSGAMTYAAPSAADLLDSLRRLIAGYYRSGGADVCAPDVLLYSADTAGGMVHAMAAELPEQLLPVAVEDVGAIGGEIWLSLLAYGAGRVLLLTGPDPAPTLVDATRRQLKPYHAILAGLGDDLAGQRLQLLTDGLDPADWSAPLPAFGHERAGFAALGTKREILRQALGHLHAQAVSPPEIVPLPAPAPFGTINVDGSACTLCMACVSVCPVSAIQGGGDLPQLHFRESHCVQCGMCEQACPEDAISLQRQMSFAEHLEPAPRLVHEEAMHHCDGCGKPFATQRMIESMVRRLQDHWMFQNADALARIRLCEDCRIQKLYADEGGITIHPSSRRT